HCWFRHWFDCTRDYARCSASWFHNDHTAWDCRFDHRWVYRPVVFQTGTGGSVSSRRLHHVDHRRDHSVIYLDKIRRQTTARLQKERLHGHERIKRTLRSAWREFLGSAARVAAGTEPIFVMKSSALNKESHAQNTREA